MKFKCRLTALDIPMDRLPFHLLFVLVNQIIGHVVDVAGIGGGDVITQYMNLVYFSNMIVLEMPQIVGIYLTFANMVI